MCIQFMKMEGCDRAAREENEGAAVMYGVEIDQLSVLPLHACKSGHVDRAQCVC